MSKQCKYSSKEIQDDMEGLADRLAADLRKNIRALGSHAIFSEAWNEMAETSGRIAKVSDMESNIAASKNDATLWETEEQALRYLLEDGKLNLCLRNLIEYKKHQKQYIIVGEEPASQQKEIGSNFEKGVGTVLRNAWTHIEALQTTDIPALAQYIGDVLEFGTLHSDRIIDPYLPNNDLHQRQEVVVFEYMAGIFHSLAHIEESRVMPFFRDAGVFGLSVQMLTLLYSKIEECDLSSEVADTLLKHIFKGCVALSLLVETEDFTSYTVDYIDMSSRSNTDVCRLLKLGEICTREFSRDHSKRGLIRPLMDFINKTKRQAGRK